MHTRTGGVGAALIAHDYEARRPGDGEPETRRALARFGGVAALGGALALFASTLMHPLDADPNAPRAAFAEYAADPVWVWSHLGQFTGLAMLGAALVALAATLEPGGAEAWGRIGVVGAAAMVAVGAALQAVDGVALKIVVERWASAAGGDRASAFEAAFAVRQVEVGLASLLSLVSGLTLAVFGVALILSARYPAWLGVVGLLGGLGMVAAGAAQASTGFSGLAMDLSMPASFVLLAWAVLAGLLMWRSAPRSGAKAMPPGDG